MCEMLLQKQLHGLPVHDSLRALDNGWQRSHNKAGGKRHEGHEDREMHSFSFLKRVLPSFTTFFCHCTPVYATLLYNIYSRCSK